MADLKHILRHNQRNSSIDSLADASLHRIYEVLFTVVINEQSAHARAKTASLKSGASNRLQSCAGALRLAVEVGVVSVKLKTVKALLDHIIETLPSSDGELCEPIALDYPKIMRIILARQSHVEHLPKAEWERTSRFCIKYIQASQSAAIEGAGMNGAGATFTSSRSSRSRHPNSISSQGSRGFAKSAAEELMACLRLLTGAPNAPVPSLASEAVWSAIRFLQSNSASNPAHQEAFAVIGNVLAWTRTENISLTQQVTSPLIRLMGSYWGPKTSGLKEMLVVSMHIRLFLTDRCNADGADLLVSELSALLESLKAEYSKRQERDQLHLDDLQVWSDSAAPKRPAFIQCGILSLRTNGSRAEQGWTVVHLIAFITGLLRDNGMKDLDGTGDDSEERPRKRLRGMDDLGDLLSQASNGVLGSRIAALQTLAFLTQQSQMSATDLRRILDSLKPHCSDENAALASWSLTAVTSCAYQASSTDGTLVALWTSLWQVSCRSITSPSTCRAACGVLCIMLRFRLIPQAVASELYQSLAVAFELSGPHILCDTALALVQTIMRDSVSIHPSSAPIIANSAIGWLLRRWVPSKFDERSYATSCTLFTSVDVVGLVALYLGQPSHLSESLGYPVWDVLGRSWLRAEENEQLIHYLLSLSDNRAFLQPSPNFLLAKTVKLSVPKASSEALILNHLVGEMTRTENSFSQIVHDRPQGVSSDVFAALCQFAAASTCMAHCIKFSDTRAQLELQRQCHAILKLIARYASDRACGQDKVDIMLTSFASTFWPPSTNEATDGARTKSSDCRSALCRTITEAFASRATPQDIDVTVDEEDMMEVGHSYESQESRRGLPRTGAVDLVDDSSISNSTISLRAVVPLYASIITACKDETSEVNSMENASSIAMDAILSLPEATIIASRLILANLPSLIPNLAERDTERLLEFLTDSILQDYAFERSEVAIGTILDAMIGLKSFWTNTSNKNLADLALDMYDWCVSTALKAGVLSPSVQKKVSTLLLQLCHVNTDYGRDDDVPSVRTSLFDLLQRGAISVQFHLAERIATIFSLFTLSAHGAMFDDLQNSLPAEFEWTEGLAMRLLFLANLACSWHSLLRQSIYYIFETAGRAENSRPYAAVCVEKVASSLDFANSQKLFHLFAPQLLHSWLQDQALESLPYAAFGFDSLRELLVNAQVEVTAQSLMRGLDRDMQFLADQLGAEGKELLKHSFGKSVAYAISRDIISPSSEQSVSCENRLRNIIGSKEEYRELSADHFATIMGHFFLCVNQDDVDDGWLAKRNKPVVYTSASKALAEIKEFSFSKRPMPAPQQPSFKGKYLPDQMERFCRRTSHDPTAPWESSTFSVAARMLFDHMNSGLGSLHNCTILRKLRLLVATAGEVAVMGYPLEMLLRGIQPYLTDSQCADDALGIVDYLMHRGKRQLAGNPTFLCGIFTNLLLAVRAHMGSKQDNTTQETQHRETVQKMHSFYSRSVQYLRDMRVNVSAQLLHDYEVLTGALSRLDLPGNVRKGSPESALLLLLVRQTEDESGLFAVGDSRAALITLTRNFQVPQSMAEDALGDDVLCIEYAPYLWRAIQVSSFDDHFLSWSAKVIGRAYAASGSYDSFPKKRRLYAAYTNPDHLAGAQRPYAFLIRRLCEIVRSPTRVESGLAEFVLRIVASELVEDSADEATFRETLPEILAPSISRGTYGYLPPTVPQYDIQISNRQMLKSALKLEMPTELTEWATGVALVLCRWPSAPTLLNAMPTILLGFPHLTVEFLPAIIHMILEIEAEGKQDLQSELSAAIREHLNAEGGHMKQIQEYILDLILYMRRQPYPREATKVDRSQWLDVDYMRAAQVAATCGKPTLALLLAESSVAPSQKSRRASSRTSAVHVLPAPVREDLLLSIFEQVDEPDSFYGVERPASLESVLGRLDYEKSGFKSLMFRSAQVDSHMRQSGELGPEDALGMVRSLSSLNLSSLTFALTSGMLGNTAAATGDMLESARKLQQWDVALPETSTDRPSRLLNMYKELSHAVKLDSAVQSLDNLALQHIHSAQKSYALSRPSQEWFTSLALVSESLELTAAHDQHEVLSIWSRMQDRQKWMEKARFEDFDLIQQGRITSLGVLGRNDSLLTELHVARNVVRTCEANALLSYSSLARQHGQLQTALCAATQVNDLALDLQASGVRIEAAVKHEIASILWESEESTASVKMLRETLRSSDMESQHITVGRSDLLAQLGKQLADARLEKPSSILEEYLRPAIAHLPKEAVGREAGRVYHAFAAFCDQQLQHQANVEDFSRISTLRQRKLEEVRDLQALVKAAKRPADKKDHERTLSKAEQWFKLDDEEFQHQKASRETFVQQSLQNYLLALRASDEHNLSVLRFFALWLETSESAPANEAVNKILPSVPSWKFVVLLNQLMSRLKNDNSSFHLALSALTKRMCLTHPYHSVHHVYASTRSPATKDEATVTRFNAAALIRQQISNDKGKGDLFKRLFSADSMYRLLAEEQIYDQKSGKRALQDISTAVRVARKIPELRLPPVTITLPLHPDGNYDDVPYVTKFGNTVSIMTGLSAPKVLTAFSSDGKQYKQLFKSGNDDLRQDAIMEQVFEEVSKMLQNHKATRQRNLHIRTYKVIPTSARSGIIEFVPHSIPINEFLAPAHARYYPQDLKNNAAREKIRAVQSNSTETRVKEFRKVCDHLHPVMRHFFLERFDDPDDWFEKRTAYTRTTASVSMLGHILGLGDRHGHNIMLDEKTGEVVHIDLGIAFEAGRVLPVPELVPFRLTRDIVDGMGVTKTEGIFRRCCEFTMDALREDKDSIMTLLNVLRYDPLYSWTVSPLRAKRMQEAQDGLQNAKGAEAAETSKSKSESDGGEADRALAIVEKKLSKTLSTAATVNELIQQATDEKNLATLFAGWAAWF